MSLVKRYTLEETKAAIKRADDRNINTLKMVRNDVSTADWGARNVRVANRNPDVAPRLQWPGRKDVGHTFRHVEGTAPAGKSTYANEEAAANVTRQLLNSADGQAKLAQLQRQNLALYDNNTLRVTADINGYWMGKSGACEPQKRIKKARCEIMKLGDLLWVHSTYPIAFER